MRKVIVNEWMSLDGVVQAPGQADEDTDGGFRHGGWHLRYFDEPSQKWVVGGCPNTWRRERLLIRSSGRTRRCSRATSRKPWPP